MKVFSYITALVASALIGQAIAAPVANVVAVRSEQEARGLVSTVVKNRQYGLHLIMICRRQCFMVALWSMRKPTMQTQLLRRE